MKTLLPKLLSMLACLSLAFVVTGYGESAEKTKGYSKATLEKYDADGDGKLNEAELAKRNADIKAKAAETRKSNLEQYDADGDGKLSKEERARMQTDRKAAADAKKAEAAAKRAEREAKKAEKAAKQADNKSK